jgi:D-glycero-D-manno-heptose 1,7-bisphosphate phosphatase
VLKAAFLDRDGVINKRAPGDGYITRPQEFELLPGVAEAIALLNRAGFLVIVVTNQRGIARGLYSQSDLAQIHAKMKNDLAAAGAHLDAIYFCPHDREPPCDCRKPSPGMLLTAAAEHDIDLSNSWMIGDSDSDREAGRRAGCRTITISAQTSSHEDDSRNLHAESLLAAARKLVSLPETSSSF